MVFNIFDGSIFAQSNAFSFVLSPFSRGFFFAIYIKYFSIFNLLNN